jgi:hypothetical protein
LVLTKKCERSLSDPFDFALFKNVYVEKQSANASDRAQNFISWATSHELSESPVTIPRNYRVWLLRYKYSTSRCLILVVLLALTGTGRWTDRLLQFIPVNRFTHARPGEIFIHNILLYILLQCTSCTVLNKYVFRFPLPSSTYYSASYE